MNNRTLKKELISNYSLVPLMEGFESNLVTVITPAGIITGMPISDEETNASAKTIENINSVIVNKYRTDLGIEDGTFLPDNDGFFTLKNAKLLSGTTTSSLDVINIFFDQVVAITIGKASN